MHKLATRTTLLIILSIYLTGIYFLIGAISADLLVIYSVQDSTVWTGLPFIDTIFGLPLWFSTIFIYIPQILWFYLVGTSLLPTVNAGA